MVQSSSLITYFPASSRSAFHLASRRPILSAMAFGALRNPERMGFPGSRNLQQYPAAHNAELIAGSGLHWGTVTAFLAVIVAYVVMQRHILGFQIRVSGEAPRAARFQMLAE